MPEAPQAVDLPTLLRAALGDHNAAWLATTAVDDAGQPVMSRQSAYDLLTLGPGWIKPATIKAIARVFGWQDSTVYIANAVSLGLNPPSAGTFATLLPGYVDRLPLGDQMLVRDLLIRLGQARGLAPE